MTWDTFRNLPMDMDAQDFKVMALWLMNGIQGLSSGFKRLYPGG